MHGGLSPMGCPRPCSRVGSEGLGAAGVEVGAIPCSHGPSRFKGPVRALLR